MTTRDDNGYGLTYVTKADTEWTTGGTLYGTDTWAAPATTTVTLGGIQGARTGVFPPDRVTVLERQVDILLTFVKRNLTKIEEEELAEALEEATS
jgi:hypothetical protein